MTIAMQDAVRIAKTQAQQLFSGEDMAYLLLEEVDFDEEKQAWLITLGYDSHQVIKITKAPEIAGIPFIEEPHEIMGGEIIEEKKPRVYKIFQIDASDGRLISIKMRDV
ncbi:MAG: hypothetical protein D3916_15975 [Candidatus Electrothrix sp. MAN1_4]|nr:hypothetical protein [Candidatus Electrothrix sp. MAN1_4]